MAEEEIKRLFYYNKQYLGFKDFQDEQKYHMDMRRRHNLAHHSWGIVSGLELERKESFQGSQIYETFIKPGMAVDGYGREIVLFQPIKIDEGELAAKNLSSGTNPVYLAYKKNKSNPPKEGYRICSPEEQYMRWRETCEIILGIVPKIPPEDHQAFEPMPDDPEDFSWPVYLGKFIWDSTTKAITGIVEAEEDEERIYAGSTLWGKLVLGPSGNEILQGDEAETKNPAGEFNRGLLIQSAQTVEINIDSDDNPSDMFAVTKGSDRTELFRIQEDGNVGIGTTNPQARLNIKDGNLQVGDNSDLHATLGPNDLQFKRGDNKPSYISQLGEGKLVLTTSGGSDKPRMTIDAKGNVGIGTTSPKLNLSIQSTRPRLVLTDNDGDAGVIEFHEGEKELRFQHWTDYGSSWKKTMMVLETGSGNVGIGTASPEGKLDVFSEGDAGAHLMMGGHRITLKGVNDPGAYYPRLPYIQWLQADNTRAMYLGWGDTNSKFINMKLENGFDLSIQGGKVGVGTNDPKASLHVNGDLLGAAKDSSGEALRIAVGTTPAGNTNWVQYSDDGIYVDIDTSSCGFSSTPLYFTSIGGISRHWTTQGATSIYSPTASEFRVYVYKKDVTVAIANQKKWHINWVAIGS